MKELIGWVLLVLLLGTYFILLLWGLLRKRHRTLRTISGRYPAGTIIEVIRFSVFAKQLALGLDSIKTESRVNTDFEQHMKECKQCREIVLQDMKTYVAQTEKEWTVG